jgi:hypothetical protein
MKRGKPMKRTPMKRKTQLAVTPEAKLKRRMHAMKPHRPKYDPAEAPARKAVYGRSEGWCEIRIPGVCTGRGEEWHHRRFRSQGGPWSPSNGLHGCRACHADITDTRPEHDVNGWWVKRHEAWADKAVLYRGQWVLLDDDGGYEPHLHKEAS